MEMVPGKWALNKMTTAPISTITPRSNLSRAILKQLIHDSTPHTASKTLLKAIVTASHDQQDWLSQRNPELRLLTHSCSTAESALAKLTSFKRSETTSRKIS